MDKFGFKVYQVIKSRRPIIKGSIAVYFHAVSIFSANFNKIKS